MKFRTVKKHIHRHIKRLARKIPRAFKNSRDRKEWIKDVCDYQIKHWKVME